MGREWLYWIGGGAAAGLPRRRRRTNKEDDTTTTATSSPGCMCAVFHLFDLHHIHHHSLSTFLQEERQPPTSSKGVEAPRNSLELEEPPPPALKPPAIKHEEILNFPAGIQIKTRTSVSASECSMDSPGTKTPNLVARLMGLDLLPEASSPSSSTPNCRPLPKPHLNQTNTRSRSRSNRCFYDDDINVGARSLPETSRIEYHRLSLQIHKDNTDEEFAATSATARAAKGRFRQDENRSPSHYAKQIAKQVRESVSRRVGLDITNTNRDEIRRDQNLLLKLSKKNSDVAIRRISDNKKARPVAETTARSPRNSTSSDTNHQSKPKHPTTTNQEHQFNKTGKRLRPQTCDQVIRSKKVEAFVRPPAANRVNLNSKKAPLSNELLHLSGPTILPVKKGPSPPATKLPQKQAQVSDALSSKRNTQLSSNASRSYKQLPLQFHPDKIFTVPENVPPDSTNGCATAPPASAAAEYRCYIQKILKRAGVIDKLTPLTLGKWHTPSHPLDPSIFYYLELFHPAAAPSASTAAVLTRRCNRKLIFQLVDELLVDILKPHLDYKPWVSRVAGGNNQFALVDELCKKVESFPAADCRVLEDIDSLIDEDLRKSALNGYFEEEGDRLVSEIAGEIVERLVRETVAVVDGVRTGRQSGWMSRDEMPLIGLCGNHPRGQHV